MTKQDQIAEMLRQEVEHDLLQSLENNGVSVVETPIGEKEWEWNLGYTTITVFDEETGIETKYKYKVAITLVEITNDGESDEE